MQKNHTGKILAIGIIVLFIGVSYSSSISIDTKSTSIDDGVEDLGDQPVDCDRLESNIEYFHMQEDKYCELYFMYQGTILGNFYYSMHSIMALLAGIFTVIYLIYCTDYPISPLFRI